MKHIQKINEIGRSSAKYGDSTPTRVSLSQDDFQTLVSGGIVSQNGVEIALQDIGWGTMIEAIEFAKGQYFDDEY